MLFCLVDVFDWCDVSEKQTWILNDFYFNNNELLDKTIKVAYKKAL